MRVVELSAHHVRIPLRKPIKHASHSRTETDNLVVRCVLGDGTIGYGEGVPRDYVTGEIEWPLEGGEVVGDRDRAQDGGDVDDVHWTLRQLLVGHGHIARTEIDGARLHLPDPASRSDRLIVDTDVGVLCVVVEPPR